MSSLLTWPLFYVSILTPKTNSLTPKGILFHIPYLKRDIIHSVFGQKLMSLDTSCFLTSTFNLAPENLLNIS